METIRLHTLLQAKLLPLQAFLCVLLSLNVLSKMCLYNSAYFFWTALTFVLTLSACCLAAGNSRHRHHVERKPQL